MHSHLSCVYHRKKSLIFDASDIFSNCGEYDMKLSLLSFGSPCHWKTVTTDRVQIRFELATPVTGHFEPTKRRTNLCFCAPRLKGPRFGPTKIEFARMSSHPVSFANIKANLTGKKLT